MLSGRGGNWGRGLSLAKYGVTRFTEGWMNRDMGDKVWEFEKKSDLGGRDVD